MNDKLWNKIQNFNFDNPEADFSFSMRLARDNGWSIAFTNRIIEEYRRFLYLAAEAGHLVTPSDEVDQAWHSHLCFTRSHWNDLCRDTIGKPSHHGPTTGGSEEREKFHDWYTETLKTYATTFGHKAPADCWPAAEKRFSSLKFERVDRGSHFIIPKRAVGISAAIAAFMVFATSCGLIEKSREVHPFIPIAVIIGGLLLFVILKFGIGGCGCGGCGWGGCGWGGGCG